MRKQPIVINGQQVGKFKASMMLLKETWGYLRADKEIIWIPFITAAINIFSFALIMFLFVVVILAGKLPISNEGQNMTPIEWVLRAAFSRWGDLFVWAIITSTVGIAIRAIIERSELLGKIVAVIIGAGWSVLTYFTVPAIILDNKSAISAISHSGTTFKRTWGETLVSNVTLGLAFFVINLGVTMGIFLLALLAFVVKVPLALVLVVGLLSFVLFVIASALIQASLEAILKVLLYMYANNHTMPQNFNSELLANVLVAKTPTTTAAPAVSEAI
jgi:hypothetical protein